MLCAFSLCLLVYCLLYPILALENVRMSPQNLLLTYLHSLLPRIKKIRQDLHAYPELGFEEYRTSTIVADFLRKRHIEVIEGVGKTGVVGVLHGNLGSSERSIGLRADMDALPIQEKTQLPYASKQAGKMHACGHDGHTAILLAAADYLSKHRDFSGTVYFIFQPAEEGLGGAQAMIDDGLFNRFPCDAVFALHNWPNLPSGHIGVNTGPMMAAADTFTITINGHGGHGAHPYQTKDPVIVASQLVSALQSIVARNVHPFEAAVVTVAGMQAGQQDAFSVISGSAKLWGTVRTFNQEVQQKIVNRMQSICDGLAQSFEVHIELDYQRLFPATINTEKHAQLIAQIAIELFGADQVETNLIPSMGAEDFSFMLQQCPGAYFRLGQGGLAEGKVLHNSAYDFNDEVIPHGAAMFVRLAQQFLASDI